MNVRSHRDTLNWSSARIRRARRLYLRLCAPLALQAIDDSVMERMIRRMYESGLYAMPASGQIPWRDGRYRIARHLYKMAGSPQSSGFGWSIWCRANGFGRDFNKSAPPQPQVA